MSTARFLIGDVFERLAGLADGSIDLVVTSPPFLALRAYLPEGHPDKALEIGSEPTPAAYLDTLLALTSEWGRVLAPHGSIAVELGDTYAGSGGAGGDYDAGGLRDSQRRYSGTAVKAARAAVAYRNPGVDGGALRDRALDEALGVRPARRRLKGQHPGWPLDKSLCLIPELYAIALSYGINPLTGTVSPAGLWRVRTIKPWIRSNPPVGALGDKERPATSFVIVAARHRDRYFDLDAVRTRAHDTRPRRTNGPKADGRDGEPRYDQRIGSAPGGAPPRDWWHHVDAVIDAVIDEMAGKPTAKPRAGTGTERPYSGKEAAAARGGNWAAMDRQHDGHGYIGARGVHIRRALERAGILVTLEALDVSASGYTGAHYAVWPPELVRLLVDEMCPRWVCTACGQPSRRIVDAEPSPYTDQPGVAERRRNGRSKGPLGLGRTGIAHGDETRRAITTGWTHCSCGTGCTPTTWHKARHPVIDEKDENTGEQAHTRGGRPRWRHTRVIADPGACADPGHWRPGLVLDPFVGSGTTLAVATGMGRNAVGIDIDHRNAVLALERVGPLLLHIDWPPPDLTRPALPPGGNPADYRPWAHLIDLPNPATGPAGGRAVVRRAHRTPGPCAGQIGLFALETPGRRPGPADPKPAEGRSTGHTASPHTPTRAEGAPR